MSLADMETIEMGLLTNPVFSLGWLMSNLEAFQSWTKTSIYTDAARHVHFYEIAKPTAAVFTVTELETARPLVMLDYDDEGGMTHAPHRTKRTSQGVHAYGGRIVASFESNVMFEDSTNPSESKMKFLAHIEQIEDGLLKMSGNPNYSVPAGLTSQPRGLFINNIWYPNGPAHRSLDSVKATMGVYWFSQMVIDFGI